MDVTANPQTLAKIAERMAQIQGEISAIEAAAEAAGHMMTEEELKSCSEKDAEFNRLDAEYQLRQKSESRAAVLAQPRPRLSEPTPIGTQPPPGAAVPAGRVQGGTPVAWGYSNHGFKMGFGEYLLKVREARTSGRVDPRLMVAAVTTYGGESVGGDGGYLAPPQFTQGIMELVTPADSFVNALNPVPTTSNMITVPTDEDPPWGTSGITAAKTAEAGAITASKPAILKLNIVMHAIKSLVSVSNEMLRDVSFIANYVQRKMATKIRWKVENYIINGTGMDEPLGILNSPGLLTLSSDIESTTTTLGALDVMAQKAAALNSTGFWIVQPNVRAQIWGLRAGTNGYPLWLQDMQRAPGGTLLGDPLYTSEACKAYNTAGDIIFVSGSDAYIVAFESGGPQQATSVEWAFDQDLTSFRATLRMGGAPTLSNTFHRGDGSTHTSNLVVLAARS